MGTSQKLQNLLFPDGILWDKEKDDYRTFNENEVLAVIARVSSSYENKKEDFPEEKSSKVNLCQYLPDYRTFIDDYLKILDFIEWLKDFYPEKAIFLSKKT